MKSFQFQEWKFTYFQFFLILRCARDRSQCRIWRRASIVQPLVGHVRKPSHRNPVFGRFQGISPWTSQGNLLISYLEQFSDILWLGKSLSINNYFKVNFMHILLREIVKYNFKRGGFINLTKLLFSIVKFDQKSQFSIGLGSCMIVNVENFPIK